VIALKNAALVMTAAEVVFDRKSRPRIEAFFTQRNREHRETDLKKPVVLCLLL
jgi:hypothetical protein